MHSKKAGGASTHDVRPSANEPAASAECHVSASGCTGGAGGGEGGQLLVFVVEFTPHVGSLSYTSDIGRLNANPMASPTPQKNMRNALCSFLHQSSQSALLLHVDFMEFTVTHTANPQHRPVTHKQMATTKRGTFM